MNSTTGIDLSNIKLDKNKKSILKKVLNDEGELQRSDEHADVLFWPAIEDTEQLKFKDDIKKINDKINKDKKD